tara:strand:- start:910 stop:1236 length:327 start_codon:yes stop_codon:yes gene_type:complete
MTKVTYEKKEITTSDVTKSLEEVVDHIIETCDEALGDYTICDGHPYLDGYDDGDEYRVSMHVDTVDLMGILRSVKDTVIKELTQVETKGEPEDWTTTALSPQVEEEVV